jgi:hypothetical protein
MRTSHFATVVSIALTKILARCDGIYVHEDLFRTKTHGQAVVQASGGPPTFLAAVTDEDLPTHVEHVLKFLGFVRNSGAYNMGLEQIVYLFNRFTDNYTAPVYKIAFGKLAQENNRVIRLTPRRATYRSIFDNHHQHVRYNQI